eukprot:TRINITY_DN649_c0_g2_i4.p1 TRINITY_DN649_c0_g2~~TRINITY_DN649_c0_g2_i4.p1  ORF type:complete len:284 (+),score=50.09 TRINITY_DN649_c0_g2_i4:70-921(+)
MVIYQVKGAKDRGFSFFDPTQRDNLFTVSLLVSPRAGTYSYVYLNGSEVLRCPMKAGWKFSVDHVQLFDDDAQWRFLPAPVDVYSAYFYRSMNDKVLSSQAMRLKPKDGGSYIAAVIPRIDTNWVECVFTRNQTRGLTESMRCKVEIQTTFTVGSLSLGCSRPDCSVRVVYSGNVEKKDWPIVEYRPNYPENFVSEDVGAEKKLQDNGYLTDGFAFWKFRTDMTFTSQTVQGGAFVETEANEAMETDAASGDGVQLGDVRRYISIDSRPTIAPMPAYYSEDVF